MSKNKRKQKGKVKATIYLDSHLKRQLMKIAKNEERSFTKVVERLLRYGAGHFKEAEVDKIAERDVVEPLSFLEIDRVQPKAKHDVQFKRIDDE